MSAWQRFFEHVSCHTPRPGWHVETLKHNHQHVVPDVAESLARSEEYIVPMIPAPLANSWMPLRIERAELYVDLPGDRIVFS